MKKSIFTLALSALFLGAIVTSCNSPQDKVANAKEDLHEAQMDLEKYKRDSVEKAEWAEFKANAQAQIDKNRAEIVVLREKRSKPDRAKDPLYDDQIIVLEQRTIVLQTRIDDYEKYNSNWENFKREFNHDMDELGKSLKDISKDNAK